MVFFLVPENSKLSITVSVVSHGQNKLVEALLNGLMDCRSIERIVLTHNIPEADFVVPHELHDKVQIIRNQVPKGFAANHNQAFQLCETAYFAVLNPDLVINEDPFPWLLEAMITPESAICAPLIENPNGQLEDSVRYFPTIRGLLLKLIGTSDGRFPISCRDPLPVDWAAGMFLMFRSRAYSTLGGFDEGFFLYYEDVDICARAWIRGWHVVLDPRCRVVHDARRASHRNLLYMKWHLFSLVRYLCKYAGQTPRRP